LLSVVFLLAVCLPTLAQNANPDEAAVRKVVEDWNRYYQALDGTKLASLSTPEFDIVNRLGMWTHKNSNPDLAEMWNWSFKFIYKNNPGPEHKIDHIRFLNADTAAVLTRAYWGKELTLDDGTKIPPHGEIDSFIVVKKGSEWKIAWLDIHNQMPPFDKKPGEPLETPFPPPPGSEPK
jgi:uncharacterized protein (TIGR02246 family)